MLGVRFCLLACLEVQVDYRRIRTLLKTHLKIKPPHSPSGTHRVFLKALALQRYRKAAGDYDYVGAWRVREVHKTNHRHY